MYAVRTLLRPGAVLILAVVLAACSGGGTDGASDGNGNAGGGTVAVTDGEVVITADNLQFDASTIQATAGEEFNITFTNAESQPHNISVYSEADGGGDEIVIGEIITGPDVTTQVAVPALEPGTYYFRCDVHPEMEGTIVVEG
jgi:plastocyanin